MENLRCLRCGTTMIAVGRERLQMGKTGWVPGGLPNLVAGALEVEIFASSAVASWSSSVPKSCR